MNKPKVMRAFHTLLLKLPNAVPGIEIRTLGWHVGRREGQHLRNFGTQIDPPVATFLTFPNFLRTGPPDFAHVFLTPPEGVRSKA